MVLGYDEEKNVQLFKCDPAGHFFGHKVCGYFAILPCIVATFLLNEYCWMSSFLVSAGYLLKNNQSADIFFQATSAGLKEQEAINFLKKMKDDPQFTYDETVQVMCTKQYFCILLKILRMLHQPTGLHN